MYRFSAVVSSGLGVLVPLCSVCRVVFVERTAFCSELTVFSVDVCRIYSIELRYLECLVVLGRGLVVLGYLFECFVTTRWS